MNKTTRKRAPASTDALGNYSVHQSLKRTIEIDNFQSKTSITDHKVEKVTSADGSVIFWIFLWPGGVHLKNPTTSAKNVYISLHREVISPQFAIQLSVSLIDVRKEKQLTKFLTKSSSTLENENIYSLFTSRKRILDSPDFYLHDGTLKVLFEVSILKEGASAPLSTQSENYSSLPSNGSDVTLLVGERQFPVHMAILSARSPVFEQMFKELKENRFVIEDIDEQVFSELLNYIYTEKVENLAENASKLLIAAEKYQIEALRDLCCQNLLYNLTAGNLLPILRLANALDYAQLQSQCLAFFERHSRQVKLTENWKQLISVQNDVNQEILGLLLQTVLESEYPEKKVKLSR